MRVSSERGRALTFKSLPLARLWRRKGESRETGERGRPQDYLGIQVRELSQARWWQRRAGEGLDCVLLRAGEFIHTSLNWASKNYVIPFGIGKNLSTNSMSVCVCTWLCVPGKGGKCLTHNILFWLWTSRPLELSRPQLPHL